MSPNDAHIEALNQDERKALEMVSQVLADIRFTCSGTVDEITQWDVRHMHDLADATHNIPRVLAKVGDEREALAFLVPTAKNEATEIYAELNKPNPHRFSQMVLYEDDELL